MQIFHFKALDLRNLQYEITICQKILNEAQRHILFGYNFYASDFKFQNCWAKGESLEKG